MDKKDAIIEHINKGTEQLELAGKANNLGVLTQHYLGFCAHFAHARMIASQRPLTTTGSGSSFVRSNNNKVKIQIKYE